MSKEQALAEYLKKSADPSYASKVIGGGIIFKKAQSKESWKKRTYYIKDDKKLLYFYYGGKAKPPLGMLDVTSSLLSIGPLDNIKKSGAMKDEAVSITTSLAHETTDNNTKHFVFETVSEAKKFALMLAYTCRNSNVAVFAQMMEWADVEEACSVVSGTSVRKFLDLDKCTKEGQLQSELVKYEDEIGDYEHRKRLFTSIKAQNSNTKTIAESFEVLQANLLLPLVEQRLDYLLKRKQDVNEKYLQVRSFVAGVQTAKQQSERSSVTSPPQNKELPISDSPPSSPSSTGSVEQRRTPESRPDEGSEEGGAESGSKTLRLKSFRRLLSVSRQRSISRSASISSDDTPSISPRAETKSSTPPPPPPPARTTTKPSPDSTPIDNRASSNGSSVPQGVASNPQGTPSSLASPSLQPRASYSVTPQNVSVFTDQPQSQQSLSTYHGTTPLATGLQAQNGDTPYSLSSAVPIEQQRRASVDDNTHAFCAECLRTMKSFIPFDMASCDYTTDILVRKNGLSVKLAERVMKKRMLWIIHLTIREIERVADREFQVGGRYSVKGHNLDLVELAAVYAVLPGSFSQSVDVAGVKEAWRCEVEDRLVGMLRDQEQDTLTADELRHEAYTTNMGDKWNERASLDAKLNHMTSLFQVVKVEVAQGENSESTEQSFDKLVQLREQLTALMEHKRFKKILAAKKAAAKLKKRIASRHEVV